MPDQKIQDWHYMQDQMSLPENEGPCVTIVLHSTDRLFSAGPRH